MSKWIPITATHYFIRNAVNDHNPYVVIDFYNCNIPEGARPISKLSEELKLNEEIEKVCQQIKDKPLHSRIDFIGQNGNELEYKGESGIMVNSDKEGSEKCLNIILKLTASEKLKALRLLIDHGFL